MLSVKLHLTNILPNFFVGSSPFVYYSPNTSNIFIFLFRIALLKPLDDKLDTTHVEYPVMEKVMKFRHIAHQGVLGKMSLFPFIKDN